MGCLRPATPGFITTLTATILLIVVSFCVPWFKSIYFLKASLNSSGIEGSITLGTLGYCLQLPGNTTCSKASVGYEFDPNKILGNDLPIQIPEVVVKWITYALVLHIVAMVLAAISAVFGLLAHVREMSMSCFSSCISGFAAAVALIAFIFDLVFFFVVKGRINKVQGGSATIGNAIWLTLAAWILLFISGCMFGIGRCCVSKRSPRAKQEENGDKFGSYNNNNNITNPYAESMWLDAVKAEADRKARQAAGTHEVGLPTFQEYERRPLRSPHTGEPQYLEEEEEHQPYSDVSGNRPGQALTGVATSDVRRQPSAYSSTSSGPRRQLSNPAPGPYPGGYAGGAQGTRAVDGYYNASPAVQAGSPSGYGAAAAIGAAAVTSAAPRDGYGSTPYAVGTAAYPPNRIEQNRQHSYDTAHYHDPYAQQQLSGAGAVYDPYATHEPYRSSPSPSVVRQDNAAYQAPYGAPPNPSYNNSPGGFVAQPTYYNEPTAHDPYRQPSPRRRPTGDGQDSYFPTPAVGPYYNQSPVHSPSPGPRTTQSPLHIDPSAVPALFSSPSPIHAVPSPVSAGVSPVRRQSVGGPRQMPTREEVPQIHNWNSGPSDDDHTMHSEAPPSYNPYDASSSMPYPPITTAASPPREKQ